MFLVKESRKDRMNRNSSTTKEMTISQIVKTPLPKGNIYKHNTSKESNNPSFKRKVLALLRYIPEK